MNLKSKMVVDSFDFTIQIQEKAVLLHTQASVVQNLEAVSVTLNLILL